MTVATKPRDEGTGEHDVIRLSPAAAEPTRPERLLSIAVEIIDLDRLIKDLQAKRDALWARFSSVAGPEPTQEHMVQVAVPQDDAAVAAEPNDGLVGKVRWFFQQVREPIDAETVAVALGIQGDSLPSLRATLVRLAEAGEVRRVGRGQYVKGRGHEAK